MRSLQAPPVPTPPGSCHHGPRSRSLENVPRALAQNEHIAMPPRPDTTLSNEHPSSPVPSTCPTSGQGTGTTIVQNRPVSPATSRVTVSTDTDHQSPVRSAHEHTARDAQPLRVQAAVCELPPAEVPAATQPLPPACIALSPVPTTKVSAPPPQASAEASGVLHPFLDGQTEVRAFPTATPTTKLPSSDMPSPGKHSLDAPPPQVPKKLKPKELREFSGEEKQESWDVFFTHYKLVKQYNGWDDLVGTQQLGLSLKDAALDYYVDLPEGVRNDHETLQAAMARRFGRHRSLEKVRNQLQKLKQKPDQSLEDLAQEVRSLTYALMAKTDPAYQQSECICYFIGAFKDETLALHLHALNLGADDALTMEKVLEQAIALKETMFSVKATSASRTVREITADFVQQIQDAVGPTSEPDTQVSDILDHMNQLGIPTTQSSGGATTPKPPWRNATQGQNPRHGNKFVSRPKTGQNPTRPCFTCSLPGHWQNECPYRAQLQAQLGTTPPLVAQTPGQVAGSAPTGVPFPFQTPSQFQPQQFAAVHPGMPAQQIQPQSVGVPTPYHVAQANVPSRAGQGSGRGHGRNHRGPDTRRSRGQPGSTPRVNVTRPPRRSAQNPLEQSHSNVQSRDTDQQQQAANTPVRTSNNQGNFQ